MLMESVHIHTQTGIPDSKVHGANMGPPGADRTQVGPMLASWTLLYMQQMFGHIDDIFSLTDTTSSVTIDENFTNMTTFSGVNLPLFVWGNWFRQGPGLATTRPAATGVRFAGLTHLPAKLTVIRLPQVWEGD